MGAEKGGPKGSGFFHIFDWSRKSRKKLFSVSPENTKQEKRTDDSLPGTRLQLVDEDDRNGVSSTMGSTDYSCASSVTDEGIGIRVPGVVARLMGLDSMPTSGISEPYSTPLFDTRSLQDKQSHKRSPEFFINDNISRDRNRTEVYTTKPLEFRNVKMPSSPIERFQIETLPSRTAKAFPLTHHRLLSPIKNPGFVSPRNTAQIMEAAARILEPAGQSAIPVSSKRVKSSSSYIPLQTREPKDNITSCTRTSRALEFARREVEPSDMRYLRGQSLNRSWNGSEDSSSTFRPSPDISDTNLLDGNGRGKSISLAIQAKVNVQKREGISLKGRNALPTKKDDDVKLNLPFKSQPSNQKNKQHKKNSASGSSTVLRQNNQKQNCSLSKGKSGPKQSVSGHQGKKILYESASGKNKATNKLSGNARASNREDNLDSELEDLLSSNKDFPRKKRLIDGCLNSQRKSQMDNVPLVHQEKHVEPNVMIDEQPRWSKDNRTDSADVVSFTFTSPLVKPTTPDALSSTSVENFDKRSIYSFDNNFKRNGFTAKKQPQNLNLITGDSLSLLLEQKLRELNYGADEPSNCSFIEAACSTSATVQQEQAYDFNSIATNSARREKQIMSSTSTDKQSSQFARGNSSTNGLVFGLSCKCQGVEKVEYNSSDARNAPTCLQPSPLSILEASFSSESCNSSVSTSSTNGSKISLHSVQAQNIFSPNMPSKNSLLKNELELSDSASSSSPSQGFLVSSEKQPQDTETPKQDLEYVIEILKGRRSGGTDVTLQPLDPCSLLFNELESKRGKDGRTRRKMMFDCVKESLESRRNRFLGSGYKAWASGEALMPEDMAEDVYEEICRWKGFGDCMVDELVDRDMSSHGGKWVDFEIDAFLLGVEIEKELMFSLVNELLTDCFLFQP